MRGYRGTTENMEGCRKKYVVKSYSKVLDARGKVHIMISITDMDDEMVIYNRVRKSGSRTVLKVMSTLSKQNGFQLNSSSIYRLMNVTLGEQAKLVNFIESIRPPFIYERHIHYLDFSRFGYGPPIYINFIRDPSNRFVSDYYFERWGDDIKIDKVFKGSASAKNRSVNDCIVGGYEECSELVAFGQGSIPYFCGQDPRCMHPSEWALRQALHRLRDRYLFVGITEYLEESIGILEVLLPNLFKGGSQVFKQQDVQDVVKRSSAKGKTELIEKAINKLKKVLKFEYVFYDEAVEIFKDLMKQLRQTGKLV
ncbi:uronyl 2-sulfotransferase-like [Glandiceps talaboti]